MAEFIVRIPISGTRNGEPWPAPGERIDLPEAEALDYLNARYIVPVPAEPVVAAVISDPSSGKALPPQLPIKTAEAAAAVPEVPEVPEAPEVPEVAEVPEAVATEAATPSRRKSTKTEA